MRRIEFFLQFLLSSEELKQIYSDYLKASIKLEPWNWPWKIFTILRPLPWDTSDFDIFQKIIIFDHYITLIGTLYLLSRFSRNKIYLVVLSFLMMAILTAYISNINDMYRRLPIFLMLPMPVVLSFKLSQKIPE